MVTAPAEWLIRLLSWLPAAARPALFCAVVVLLLGFLVLEKGALRIWHGGFRLAALAADTVVGGLLLPELALTRRRRAAGLGPSTGMVSFGRLADGALVWAETTYARHLSPARRRSPVPRVAAVVVASACGIGYAVMVGAPASGGAARELSSLFDRWRDVERWAAVPADRVAAPGPGIRGDEVLARYLGLPAAGRTLHVNAAGRVTLALGTASRPAAAIAVVRNGKRAIGSETFRLAAGEPARVRVRIEPRVRRRLARVGHMDVEVTIRIQDAEGIRAAVTRGYTLAR